MPPVSANDYLFDAAKYKIPAVCAVYGNEKPENYHAKFLRFQVIRNIRDNVLAGEESEFSLSRFDGQTAEIEAVLSDVSTRTMFGNGQRLIWVEDADEFLKKTEKGKSTTYRELLEGYADNPSKSGVLLLEFDSFPSTTRLFKKLAEVGFLVDCTPMPDKEVPKWVVRWAKHRHKTPCDANAATLLVDLIGTQLGLLDQELAKLSLYVPPKGSITVEIVRQNVDAQRMLKIYEMLNFALSGRAADAIRELDKLLLLDKKTSPYGILESMSYSLRELAAATQLIIDGERTGKKISVSAALNSVVSKKFLVSQSEQQLLKLGRRRGAKLLQWLLQADLDMKGDSRAKPRLILEKLLIRIADPQLK